MNFEQMLLTRESCRSYCNTPVAREDLIKICEAGRLTPSGCNAQPWKFLVVDEETSLAKLRDALLLPGGRTGAPWRAECHAFIVMVDAFGIPEDQTVRLAVAVGYPKEEKAPRAKVRKPFEEVVCFNTWK